MKKHLSVFELAARGAVYKTLAVSLCSAAAIFALLLPELDRGGALASRLEFSEGLSLTGAAPAALVYCAGIVLLYFLLCRSLAPKRGVNPDATLRRLRVPEREAAYVQALVHALCFAVYMALALAAYLGFAALFLARSGPYENNGQSLLFAAYCALPLHTLLPLASWREGLFAAATCLFCGAGSAAFAFWRRRGRTSGFGVAAGVLLVLTHFFRVGGDAHFVVVFLELGLAAAALIGAFRDTTADEREAASAAALETQEGGGADATA